MILNPFDLTGKGVILTGGGGHLGAVTASRISEVGGTVAIVGRDVSKLEIVREKIFNTQNKEIMFVPGDISEPNVIEAALEKVYDRCGYVYGLVNNAGSNHPVGFLEYSKANVMATTLNLINTMMVTKQVSDFMVATNEKKEGSIVNIASMYGMISPNPDLYDANPEWHSSAAYGASKAGIIQFSKYAAVHLALQNIRVNSLSPGPFPNEETQESKDFILSLNKKIPLNRIGDPAEFANSVIFLLSKGSSYITGANLLVDGGWNAW